MPIESKAITLVINGLTVPDTGVWAHKVVLIYTIAHSGRIDIKRKAISSLFLNLVING
jgi:hypothetical protein